MDPRLSEALRALEEKLEAKVREVADLKRTINMFLQDAGEAPRFGEVVAEEIGSAVRPDQYYGKPLTTAVTEMLELKKQARSPHEIIEALTLGGFDFEAQGWGEHGRPRILAIALAKVPDKFHRLPNGTYGLCSWYPHLKRAEKKVEEPRRRKRGRKRLKPVKGGKEERHEAATTG